MIFLRPLTRYADFSGRARRTEYWSFVAFEMVVGGLFGGLAVISISQSESGAGVMGFFTCLALAGLCALGFAIPHLAVTVRRLHDTGRSAWWLLLQAPGALAPMVFLSAMAGVAGAGGKPSDAAVGAIMSAAGGGMLLLVIAQICHVVLMVIMWMRGTDGENRFGPDPRGPDSRLDRSGAQGLDDERIEAILASGRRDAGMVDARAPRWKPDLDFGTMRESGATWPDAAPAPTFGRRRA